MCTRTKIQNFMFSLLGTTLVQTPLKKYRRKKNNNKKKKPVLFFFGRLVYLFVLAVLYAIFSQVRLFPEQSGDECLPRAHETRIAEYASREAKKK